jgi:hypothetical protein
LVLGLQQTNIQAQSTLGKVGSMADAGSKFLKARAGWFVGGPVGALVCFLFC